MERERSVAIAACAATSACEVSHSVIALDTGKDWLTERTIDGDTLVVRTRGRMAVWNDVRGIHVFDGNGKYVTTWPLPRGSAMYGHGIGAADASGRTFTTYSINSPY